MCDTESHTTTSGSAAHEPCRYGWLHVLLDECWADGCLGAERHARLMDTLPEFMEMERKNDAASLFKHVPLILREFYATVTGHPLGYTCQSAEAIQQDERKLVSALCLVVITEAFADSLVLEIESQAGWPEYAPEHIARALTWIDDFWQVAHLLKAVFLTDSVMKLVTGCFGGRSTRQMLLNIANKTCDILCSSGPGIGSEVPSVLFCLWIRSADPPIRYGALNLLHHLFKGDPYNEHYIRHVYNSVIDATTPTAIETSVLYDLRQEAHIRERLQATAIVYDALFNGPYKPSGLDSALHQTILKAFAAAWRRETCRGTVDPSQTDMCIEIAIARTARNMPDTVYTEKFIHKVMAPVAYLVLMMIEHMNYVPQDIPLAILRKFIKIFGDMRPFRRVPASSKLHNLRIVTLRTWGKTLEKLREGCSCSAAHQQQISSLRRPCEDLGRAIYQLTQLQGIHTPLSPSLVSPLKRCAYKGCLCSIHKPIHRMRVCAGQWGLAYCGKRCHDRDKEDGEHKCR